MARSELGTVAVATGARASDQGVSAPRVIERRPGVPGGRSVVGGLLVSMAMIGVFVAYAGANRSPSDSMVVAAHGIRAGDVLTAADLRVVRGDLPPGVRSASYRSTSDVVGRVALGSIEAGELVQSGLITAEVAAERGIEVALSLPRDRVAVGRLRQGDRVDVYVTYDTHTSSVIRGAQVVMLSTGGDGSLTSEREIAVVISVPRAEMVAAVVHALRTGEVTVVRSTFAEVDAGAPIVFDAGSTPRAKSTG